MNTEEIEELKEFTIDLTNIDEIALGLEICSKKSNMVIQEFIDTIVQLQQENQSLKKENKILRENAENNDRVVDKVNWENQKLENQQKEFIEWLENEKNIYPYDISDYTYEDIINTILSKYEEIIDK